MRISRLVAGVATAALVAAVPVTIGAGPASAATAATTVTVDALSDSSVIYKDDLYFSGSVDVAGGTTPDTGTVSLQISTPDDPTFTTIATDTDAGYFSIDGIKAVGNATYQVVYSGGTVYNSTTNTTDTAAPSTSAPVGVTAERKVALHTKGLNVIGKITPNYAKKTVKILAYKGKHKTVKFKRLKTSKKGQFSFRAPNKIGFRFIVVIPASPQFAGTKAPYHVI